MTKDIITLTLTTESMGMRQTVHPVLLRGQQGWLLVDCGCTGALPSLEQALAAHGISAKEISHILITHHDHDHMGGVAAFKAAYPQVRVLASEGEVPYISGGKKSLRLAQAEERQDQLPAEQRAFGEAFCQMLRAVEPVALDGILHEGDTLPFGGGCTVIATPGHTPGHISLHLPSQSLILAGDAAVLENNALGLANPQFTLDMEQAKASMEKLCALHADTWICYHGGQYQKRSAK